MLIVYSGHDEVFVSTAEDEAKMVKDYFTDAKRDVEDYNRIVVLGAVAIYSNLMVDGDRIIRK